MEHDRDLTSVRRLVRSARTAALATAAASQPHAALVTLSCMGDLSLVLLLSNLSHHTRNLRANPACALLCTGPAPPDLENPQTTERVNLACRAAPDDNPALRARFLALHPYAAQYADFGDFGMWRLTVEHANFVGGFAKAATLEGAMLRPGAEIAAAIAAAEAAVLTHCNADHAKAMASLGLAFGGIAGDWRLVGVDPDGCDLLCATAAARAGWPFPVRNAADLRRATVELVGIAHEICTTRTGSAGMAAEPPVS